MAGPAISLLTMKNTLYSLMAFSVLLVCGCQKECPDAGFENPSCCSAACYKTTNPNSFDLNKFVTRNDDSAPFGICSSVKHVEGIGAIDWTANNRIIAFSDGSVYLDLVNYSDTAFHGLEVWAYLRETILIKFEPEKQDVQPLYDKVAFQKDKQLSYAEYDRWFDDYYDAGWKIDLNRKSYILVTEYDRENKIVAGEFNLFFVIDKPTTYPGITSAERVNFRCGKFRAKIF